MKDLEHHGVGQLVADIRHQLQLSQEEFAERLGCSARHLSKVENGHVPPVATGASHTVALRQSGRSGRWKLGVGR
jgi:DNA-binding transcriptional regulator YiaG